MSDLEKRLEELEIKFSYQQESLESLNETVIKQWDIIDRLQKLTALLKEEILNLKNQQNTPQGEEPPPPHY